MNGLIGMLCTSEFTVHGQMWIYHNIFVKCYKMVADTKIILGFFTTGEDYIFGIYLGGMIDQKGWGRKRNWLLVPFPACPTGVTKCFSISIGY